MWFPGMSPYAYRATLQKMMIKKSSGPKSLEIMEMSASP